MDTFAAVFHERINIRSLIYEATKQSVRQYIYKLVLGSQQYFKKYNSSLIDTYIYHGIFYLCLRYYLCRFCLAPRRCLLLLLLLLLLLPLLLLLLSRSGPLIIKLVLTVIVPSTINQFHHRIGHYLHQCWSHRLDRQTAGSAAARRSSDRRWTKVPKPAEARKRRERTKKIDIVFTDNLPTSRPYYDYIP